MCLKRSVVYLQTVLTYVLLALSLLRNSNYNYKVI